MAEAFRKLSIRSTLSRCPRARGEGGVPRTLPSIIIGLSMAMTFIHSLRVTPDPSLNRSKTERCNNVTPSDPITLLNRSAAGTEM